MRDGDGFELDDVVQGSTSIQAVPRLPSGPTHDIVSGRRDHIRVRCTEGVLREMLNHALRGFPRSEGGERDGTAVEVKGYLLGTVSQDGTDFEVTVVRRVELPIDDDLGGSDWTGFTATDRVRLERDLRNHPKLQLLGSYHSHPRHRIQLSEEDVKHLSDRMTEPYQIAAIVAPAERAVGFFVQKAGHGFADSRSPAERIGFREDGYSELMPRTPIRTSTRPWWKRPKTVGLVAGAAVVIAAVGIVMGLSGRDPVPVQEAKIHLDLEPSRLTFKDEACTVKVSWRAEDESSRPDSMVVLNVEVSGSNESWLRLESDNRLSLRAGVEGVVVARADTEQLAAGTHRGHITFKTDPESGVRVTGNGAVTAEVEVRTGPDGVPTVTVQKEWDSPGSIAVESGRVVARLRSPHPGAALEGTAALKTSSGASGGSRDVVIGASESSATVGFALRSLPDPGAWKDLRVHAVLRETRPPEEHEIWKYVADLEPLGKREAKGWNVEFRPERSNGLHLVFHIPGAPGADGDVNCRIKLDGVDHRTVSVPRTGLSFEYDGWDEGRAPSKMTFRMDYFGRDGIYYCTSEIRPSNLGFDDLRFIETQGASGDAVLRDRYEQYKDMRLSRLADIESLPHLGDLAGSYPLEFVVLSSSGKVQGSWSELAESVGGAANRDEMGRLAWLLDDSQNRVKLVLVLPPGYWATKSTDGRCPALSEWLSSLQTLDEHTDGAPWSVYELNKRGAEPSRLGKLD